METYEQIAESKFYWLHGGSYTLAELTKETQQHFECNEWDVSAALSRLIQFGEITIDAGKYVFRGLDPATPVGFLEVQSSDYEPGTPSSV